MKKIHKPVEGQTIVCRITCPSGDLRTASAYVLRLTNLDRNATTDLPADLSDVTEHTATLTHSVVVADGTCQTLGEYTLFALVTCSDRIHKIAKTPATFRVVEDNQPTS